jgi:hypothetical protein
LKPISYAIIPRPRQRQAMMRFFVEFHLIFHTAELFGQGQQKNFYREIFASLVVHDAKNPDLADITAIW